MQAKSFSFERFGYLLMERHGDDWDGVFHDMDDTVIASCRLHGRWLACDQGIRALILPIHGPRPDEPQDIHARDN
jgi:hypothetical protein